MKHLTHWILALAVLAPAASFSDAWSRQEQPRQEQPKQDPPTQEPPKEQKQPKQQRPPKKPARPGAGAGRQERHAAILKAMPELKTSLVDAIGLAEKETSGKAFSAGLEIVKGKPTIQVNLFVGEQFTVASIDPETKVVTIQKKKGDEAKDEGAQEQEEEEEGGTTEDGG